VNPTLALFGVLGWVLIVAAFLALGRAAAIADRQAEQVRPRRHLRVVK
jgi:hypothetical protein